jgi:signal transduction histidine kinase
MANPPNSTEYTRIPNQRSPESESSNREHNTDQRIREERFEAIRSFSRGVSHQFNNLLTPPLGELSILLAETTVRDLPPNTVSSLNEIKDSLVRIARYINRLAQAQTSLKRINLDKKNPKSNSLTIARHLPGVIRKLLIIKEANLEHKHPIGGGSKTRNAVKI